MKRALIILSPLLIVIALTSLGLKLLGPQIEKWVQGQVLSLSAAYSPFQVSLEGVETQLFPPALVLTQVSAVAKNPDRWGIDEIDLERITARLDLLQLLGGKLAISELVIDGIEGDLNLDPNLIANSSDRNKKTLDLNPLFQYLQIVPIHRLFIDHLNFDLGSKKMESQLRIENGKILLLNERQSIAFEVELPQINGELHGLTENGSLRVGGTLKPNYLLLRKSRLSFPGVSLNAEGELTNLNNLSNNLKGHLDLQLQLRAEELQSYWYEQLKLPELTGHATANLKINIADRWVQDAHIELQAEDLSVQAYRIGNFNIAGTWKEDRFSGESMKFQSDAAEFELPHFELQWNKSFESPEVTAKTHIKLEDSSLDDILQAIKVGDLPLELRAQGEADCSANILPRPLLRCKGELEGRDLEIGSGPGIAKNIVMVNSINAQLEAELDANSARIKGHLQMPNSSGEADGEVSYADGFNVRYSAEKLDFSDIQRLAGLRLTGSAKVSGQTVGNSHQGQFSIDGLAKDIWFQDFYLGDPQLSISYEHGNLHFTKARGQVHNSSYRGEVHVNLLKPEIKYSLDATNFEAREAAGIFIRKIQLPIKIEGPVNVHTNGFGPLQLGQLSYDFMLTAPRVNIGGEFVEQLQFGYHSDVGVGHTTQCQMQKGRSQIPCKGISDPEGIIDFSFSANPWYLEESDIISLLGSNISGRATAQVHVTGPVYDPLAQIEWSTDNLLIDDNTLPPSSGHVLLDRRYLRGDMNLFSKSLVSQFKLPFDNANPFFFEASARDWSFATLFLLIGSGPLLPEYESSLTGDISLHAESGGFLRSSGQASFTRAYLRRDDIELSNPGSMDLSVDRGNFTMKNFRVAGNDSYVELDSSRSSENHLNMKLAAKLPLHITQIFFPFLDDIKGLATLKINIGGSLNQPEVLGVGSLQSGHFKIKNFPHPLEKINANAQFSQRKILISDVTGLLAGGAIEGEGEVTIAGPHNLPSQFHFDLENGTFNLPDKVKTTGDAEIDITGSWFPFLISGTYHVKSGLITKDIGAEDEDTSAKQSVFLPKVLLQNSADPIVLSLDVKLDSPVQVRDNLIQGTAQGELQVSGTPAHPILMGKVTLDKDSKLIFKDKTFDVSIATATFRDPKEINPEIYVSANSHIADYDINLLTQGTGKNPVIKLSSTPALSEPDIISLLALGVTTTSTTNGTAFIPKDQTQNMGTQLSAAVFDQFTKPVQKALSVDIQVSSQYDDTKNLATQSYTLSKKLTDNLTFSATETQGDQADQTYKLKYNLDSKKSISTSFENLQAPTTGSALAPQTQGQILGVDFEFKEEFK